MKLNFLLTDYYSKKYLLLIINIDNLPLICDSKDGNPDDASLKDVEALLLELDSLDDTLLLLHLFLWFNAGADVVGTEGASFHAASIDSGVNCIDVLLTSGLLSLTNFLSSILFPLNSWSCCVMVSLEILGDGRSEEELVGFLSARYIGADTLSGNVGGGGGGK